MVRKRQGTPEDEGVRGDDESRAKYFDEQWERANAEDEKRDRARRLAWPPKDQERQVHYSPWLVIPYDLTDHGARPLAAGTTYWASPFVWVDSPDPSGQPRAGVPNFVVARVFNLGAATAAPTRVDFYWADPSVGLGPAQAHFIGREWVEVQPMKNTVVKCTTPWVPAFLNDGHECVFAICDNHVLDPLLQPFMPWADRHVGQRNLSVLPAIAQKFLLWAALRNAQFPAELRVLALRGVARDGFERLETPYRTFTNAAHEVLRAFRRPSRDGRVRADRIPAEKVAGFVLLDEREPLREKEDIFASAPKASPEDFGELALRLPSAANVRVRVAVELREVALPENEIIVIDVAHLVNGQLQGGYTLVLANLKS